MIKPLKCLKTWICYIEMKTCFRIFQLQSNQNSHMFLLKREFQKCKSEPTNMKSNKHENANKASAKECQMLWNGMPDP